MGQLHDLTAVEQAAAIRAGEVSPTELVAHYLGRIERLSADYGAFVTVTADRARDAARAAERRLAATDTAGRATLPPLFGVPTAVKDLALTAGIRTTLGSAIYADFVPPVSDEVVLRIERAGLLSLGKTNAPEFGCPCYTEPEVAPPARTPYDPARMAGGSSGGAAAAVAAGLVPLAHGSDGGGSIRIPASCCGLVGYKPSRGRISAAPVYGDPVGLSTSGPLARTVRDAAALLDGLAGPAVGDPAWAPPLPAGQTYLSWCEHDPGRLRVGWLRTPVITAVEIHPECAAAAAAAARLLAGLGHDVEEITEPVLPGALPAFERCWAVLAALTPVPVGREHELRPLTRWLRERGAHVSGPEFGLALGELHRAAAAAIRALDRFDVVLTPTLAAPPLPIGAIRDDADPAADFENQKRFTPFTAAWNLTGMPAVSLPLHRTAAGLPVGVMLAGRPAADHRLFALAAQVEAAAPWAGVHPACW